MVLFCKLVCAYARKICEDKFGGCKNSFSWLGEKVNNKIAAYCRDVDESGTDLPTR